ncbi:hypothetical protein IFM89_015078 [Coptis chinensis]|uniref:Uncharacterized protein n=1 Tax=Coptis chinensis TaxID=261450 RepID=A0A835M4X9_9MAGN|nr:hypothetical protein IFM89_015078 [Coptis chinensis]
MSYEKTIRALSGHFEGRAMSYEKTIGALSLHFEGTAKSYEKTIRALSLHFEGTAKSHEKTIRELSMHFEAWVYSEHLEYKKNSPKLGSTLSRFAQLLVPFFESIIEQVIPEDLLTAHSEIVRAGEAGSDVDVSEDMHCDESASGVQEGSNDMSSESDPFLAPTYESEDSADDIEVNEQGEQINVVNKPVSVPSPVNVRLLGENMSLTTTLPASRGGIKVIIIIDAYGLEFATIGYAGNSLSPVDNIITSVHAQCDMQDMREGLLSKSLSLSWKRTQRELSCFSFSVCLFLLRAALEMVVRKGNVLYFDVVPLLGLLTMTEESRFIMRKGFAQAVSIAIGSIALPSLPHLIPTKGGFVASDPDGVPHLIAQNNLYALRFYVPRIKPCSFCGGKLETAFVPRIKPCFRLCSMLMHLGYSGKILGMFGLECIRSFFTKQGVATFTPGPGHVCLFAKTEALPTPVDTEGALERGEGNVLVKRGPRRLSKQLQSPPMRQQVQQLSSTKSTSCCDSSWKSTGIVEWMHIILVHIRSLTMPPCLAPLGAMLPLVSDTVAVMGSREPVLVQQEEAVPVQQDVKEQAPVRVTRSKRQLL